MSHKQSCGKQENSRHSFFTYQIERLCVSGGWEENQHGGKREEEGSEGHKGMPHGGKQDTQAGNGFGFFSESGVTR